MPNRDVVKDEETFKAHHIASFIEGNEKLMPSGVVHHINQLHNSGRIDETPCIVRLDKKGIRVELKSTEELVEFFEWSSISDEIAVLRRTEIFQYAYLILFRCSQYNAELKRDESELHVFSCETKEDAKLLANAINEHKRATLKKSLNGSALKNPEISLRRGRSEERISSTRYECGRNFYILNNCIDDIESFEKRLEKGLRRMSNNSRNSSAEGNLNGVVFPSRHEAQETIRKVKHAFNVNEIVRPHTPVTRQIKFHSIFNTVQWLDKVCRQKLVSDYDPNMVRDIVEPLLEENTISAIMSRLQRKQQEFWEELGPAWNTPPGKWTDNISRYSPQFSSSTANKRQTWHAESDSAAPGVVDIEVKVTHTSSPRNSPPPVERARTPSPVAQVNVVEKPPEQRAKSCEVRNPPRRTSDNEQKWCVVNVHHVSAKPENYLYNQVIFFQLLRVIKETGGQCKMMQENLVNDKPINVTDKENDNVYSENYLRPQLRKDNIRPSRSTPREKSPPRQEVDTSALSINISSSPTVQDLDNNNRNNSDNADISNSFMYITPAQLQEAIKINSNVPMILIPVSNLYNNSNADMSAINWSHLINPNTNGAESARIPNPGVLGPGWKPAPILSTSATEALGYSPYPFNYPTHMHTMTRELRERLSKMQLGGGTGLKSVPIPTTTLDKPDQRLSKCASEKEVAEWLVAHQFSPRVISALKGFNGMDLYTMNRTQLEQHFNLIKMTIM
ncbi:unnamed protein product [Heterobilharzia americana]|nr:unnamed protein product [Heterobilharzia americana]